MFMHIKSNRKDGFWRCGVFHSFKGQSYSQEDFTPDQWAVLQSEPMLKLSPCDERSAGEAPSSDAELVGRLVDAIRTLQPTDFGKTGKPKIGVLRELLDEDKAAITADVLDEAWGTLTADGFEAPVAGAQ